MQWYIYGGIALYLLVMSIVAIAVTVHDKKAAKRHRRRVPERVLLILAALSGCVAMYVTMRVIHHKTLHPKFMIGIPIIFAMEAAAVACTYIALT